MESPARLTHHETASCYNSAALPVIHLKKKKEFVIFNAKKNKNRLYRSVVEPPFRVIC